MSLNRLKCLSGPWVVLLLAGVAFTSPASGEAARGWWSLQPVRDEQPPAVRDAAWPRTDVDRFVLAKLESQGMRPPPAASKRTLIRRATFDLTGLPPTPEEVDRFLADDS